MYNVLTMTTLFFFFLASYRMSYEYITLIFVGKLISKRVLVKVTFDQFHLKILLTKRNTFIKLIKRAQKQLMISKTYFDLSKFRGP